MASVAALAPGCNHVVATSLLVRSRVLGIEGRDGLAVGAATGSIDGGRGSSLRDGVVGMVEQRGLSGPAGVGLGSEDLDAVLAGDVGALLVEGGRRGPHVPQPLVPGGWHLDVAEVGGTRVAHDAAEGVGLLVGGGEAGSAVCIARRRIELPVGEAKGDEIRRRKVPC